MLHVLCITNNRFPDGGAGANRLLTITKGLISLGNKCNVHIIRPTEDPCNVNMNPVQDVYDGVPFYFTSGTNIWKHHNLVIKFFLIWLGIIRSIIIIFNLKRKKKLDVIISGFDMLSGNLLFFFVCKIIGVKYVYHVDEYPWMIIHPNKFNKMYSFIFLRFFYKLFDGIIVINKTLYEYYSQKKRKEAKIYLLPMTVDSSRFVNVTCSQRNTFDITYIGSMCNHKDGVDLLIKSFAKFVHDNKYYNAIRLILVGSLADKKQIAYLKKLTIQLNIENMVFFLGSRTRDQIPDLICNADILVLARPATKQAEGGFPTKLGEYLMTKKPVVVTNVGEISSFLKDGFSACIAEPNEESIANKFKVLFDNPALANIIGQNGYDVAVKNFDYKSQIYSFNEFVCSF
jgi:glycosyltransferase involved in cell wall biosynthesis